MQNTMRERLHMSGLVSFNCLKDTRSPNNVRKSELEF